MGKKPTFTVIRAYDVKDSTQGRRILVDRLWPRGISKDDLALDHWVKELAPSSELRQWFHDHPDKWSEFKSKYLDQLSEKADQVQELIEEIGSDQVLLIYGSKDEEHNNAVVFKEYLEKRLQ